MNVNRGACGLLLSLLLAPPAGAAELSWQPWSMEALASAKTQNRLVILDLEAVWCHWCHVMEETTYHDPAVVSRLSHYLTLRADADADPALAARYERYGWPATIIFAPDGSEIVRRRGYIAPENMVSLLDAIAADPSPGPSVKEEPAARPAVEGRLSPQQRDKLAAAVLEMYDPKYGSWGERHKLIDADALEEALERAQEGDRPAAIQVQQTLLASLALLDPVAGGMFQYSDERNWKSPHYEKILQIQADDLRLYSLAWATFGDDDWKQAAGEIHRYLRDTMRSPEGAFYASQDADAPALEGKAFYALDRAGRAGTRPPRIDTHLYARENGWVIGALIAYYEAGGDPAVLAEARQAADWVAAHRSLPAGGFRHGEEATLPALDDTLAMGQAFLALYEATAERSWLAKAQGAADYLGATFTDPGGGFVSAVAAPGASGVFAHPPMSPDQNAALARFTNRLFRYGGRASDRKLAEHAMRWLAAPEIVDAGRPVPGILLADREMARDPLHVTVVGGKDQPEAKALFAASLALPQSYKRVEWLDRREGDLPNPDTRLPLMKKPAAFLCRDGACSRPVSDPADLPALLGGSPR